VCVCFGCCGYYYYWVNAPLGLSSANERKSEKTEDYYLEHYSSLLIGVQDTPTLWILLFGDPHSRISLIVYVAVDVVGYKT
jgi:hypothetical protein